MFQGAWRFVYRFDVSSFIHSARGGFFVYFLLVMHCNEEFAVSDAVVSVHSSRVKTTGHITK